MFPTRLTTCLRLSPASSAIRIRRRDTVDGREVLLADLIISYKLFRERFTSKVTLDRTTRLIDVAYVEGPFRHLHNKWQFEPLENGGTRIHFFIDFEFRSQMLQKMMNTVFAKAFGRLMQAFIDRADELYGQRAAPAFGPPVTLAD